MKSNGLTIAALGFFLFTQGAQADWTAARRLTWNSGISVNSTIAVDPSGNLHVLWNDNTPGNPEIYYKKSTDGGSTWASSQRLTWTSGSWGPAIAVDPSGNLHVVWHDDTPGKQEMYYKKSTDGGSTWASSQRLTWTSGRSYCYPAIAVDSLGNLHIVWADNTPGNEEIYYTKSTNAGASWTASKRLTWTAERSNNSRIAVDPSGNPHLVWDENKSGHDETYYKKSADGGAAWTTAKNLTWTPGDSYLGAIVVDPSGNLHVVNQDNTREGFEVYYKKSTDGGTSWSTSQRLTWTSCVAYLSAGMAVDASNNLHVVWPDRTPGNCEIYYKKSTDGGSTWTTAKRLTWTPGMSLLGATAAIAADPSSNLHVVWDDKTPGNYEIYYKKFIK